jgi:hypothetical protein
VNALNSIVTSVFDAVLTPFERLGSTTALVVWSGIFGVLALLVFKRISWQAGIKAAKDKIKAHMIEIRLYQDDLAVVGAAVGKVLARNVVYLGLNFGPIVPLAVPFMALTAQFVVRYAYDPLPVVAAGSKVMAGRGTLLEIELAPEHAARIADVRVTLPPGLQAVSPLVRSKLEGRAFQEFVAVAPGEHEVLLELDGVRETKLVVAGPTAKRSMQPRRVSNRDWLDVLDAERLPLLWPAEPAFSSDSPFRGVSIAYPHRTLAWMPDGEGGILIAVAVASIVIGAFALKPLGVQI